MCDVIKGNGSDVTNTDFELPSQKLTNFMFFIVLKLQKFVHISANSIAMWFGSKCSILNGQVVKIAESELNFSCNSFSLIM